MKLSVGAKGSLESSVTLEDSDFPTPEFLRPLMSTPVPDDYSGTSTDPSVEFLFKWVMENATPKQIKSLLNTRTVLIDKKLASRFNWRILTMRARLSAFQKVDISGHFNVSYESPWKIENTVRSAPKTRIAEFGFSSPKEAGYYFDAFRTILSLSETSKFVHLYTPVKHRLMDSITNGYAQLHPSVLFPPLEEIARIISEVNNVGFGYNFTIVKANQAAALMFKFSTKELSTILATGKISDQLLYSMCIKNNLSIDEAFEAVTTLPADWIAKLYK